MKLRMIKAMGFTFFGLFILFNSLISQSLANEIKIEIPNWTVTVTEDTEGYANFSGKNIQYLTQSGEAMVPYNVIKVLLPPNADLNTVSATIDNVKVDELTGEWEVRPKPPEATWDGKKVITIWPKGKIIVNGYDINIYEENVLFPENLVGTITTGQTRIWRMVDIPIALYKFNPVTKKLYRLVKGTLIVEFTPDPTAIFSLKERTGIADRIGEDSVKKLTANFNEVSPAYEKIFPQAQTDQQISRYVIITTNNIKLGSSELQNFVSSKEMRGFTLEIVTEDAWGGGTGDTASENIRNWLSNNYEIKNIEYVLLMGNPNPDSGDIPMKMLWPRSHASDYRTSPSDYYYADLTGNWDLDGDGLYGEEDDFGTGGIDRNWDVLVGRIPYYGNMNDLDKILAKIIAYENETPNEAVWRQNVLLPMKPLSSSTPGYHLGEAIKDNILLPKDNWDYYRVYDSDYGLIPPPETYPCTYDNVTDAWNSSQFGAIFWSTHGSSTSASSIMNLSYAATLDDNYPGFTFQGSCHNSYPEVTNNLSYSLLKNGCIGTVGATRVSWYYPGETNVIGSTSIYGMTYEYSKRLIENVMDSGHALYEMKQVLNPGIWMNFTVFNIYGDPSTGLFTFSGFVDVPPGYWAYDAIYKIYNAGITTGCSQNPLMYCPEDNVTRAQMAVFLGRGVHGGEFTPPTASGIFLDVPWDYWAADWIEQFYYDGITSGCNTNPLLYCPTSSVTRTQMAIFLLRVKNGKNYTPPPATGIFADVPVTYWAADWIEQLYSEGITTGCATGPLRYCPENSVTRAQMAVFIMRTFGL
jgi:Peptidase family C25/S-layer homology domain